jgi:hypothetical protein
MSILSESFENAVHDQLRVHLHYLNIFYKQIARAAPMTAQVTLGQLGYITSMWNDW